VHGTPKLVGRSAELALAERALAGLSSGVGGVLTVVGEPGIGKTTLLVEIVERAHARGVHVLQASALRCEQDVPFGLAIDAMGGNAAYAVHQFQRHRMHRAMRRLVEQLAAQRPVLLALDDLQWADAGSCELLAYLVRRWPSAAVLGVFAYRPADVPDTLRSAITAGLKERGVMQIKLGPFTLREAEQLVGTCAAPRAARRLHFASAGNPLYLRELAEAPAGAPVPDRIVEFVIDELADVSQSARLFLRGAAVVGEPFDAGLAAAIVGINETEVPPLLDELQARGLVQRTGAAGRLVALCRWARFAFRAPIVGQAVYASTGEGWRIAAHTRADEALAARGAPIAMRAPHLERAVDQGDEAAGELLTQAGLDAAPRDPAGAARWFSAALRGLPPEADADRRLTLLMHLAACLMSSGATTICHQVLDHALALAPESSWHLRAECVKIAARLHQVVADRADIRALIEAEMGHGGWPGTQTALRVLMSAEHWMACEWRHMAMTALTAHRRAHREHDASQLTLASSLAAIAEKETGVAAKALRWLDDACQDADALTDRQVASTLEILVYLGQAEHELGRHRDAIRHFERGLAIARDTGQELFVVPLTVGLGFAQMSLGRLQATSDAAAAALRAAARLGADRPRTLALMLGCASAMRRGETAVAIEAGHEADVASRRAGSSLLSALANRWLGEALITSGACEVGKARILDHCGGAELARVPAHMRAHVFAVLAAAEIERERMDAAERWVVSAETHARQLMLAPATADATLARAALLFAQRDHRAPSAASDAGRAFSRLGQQVDAARANMLAGRAFARQQERALALEHLQLAYAAFDVCGAVHDRDRVAFELRSLGHRVGRARLRASVSPGGLGALTPRERQVAERVAMGYTNQRIADDLYIGAKTIETHLSNIFGKLGASSRAEVAAQWAAQPDGHGTTTRDVANVSGR
jgi:DNA-binding CsgD family transcriptional regulator